MDDKTNLLRHTVATLAYRGGKTLRGAPAEFAEFHAGQTTRAPAQILAHIGDLLDWALSLAEGREAWHDSPPLTWEEGTARFVWFPWAGIARPIDNHFITPLVLDAFSRKA
jgi:hypothetical protein